MHIHILGICGTFMGGIAAIARESGHKVTGCDTGVYPPMSTQLTNLGIELISGYDPDQIKLKPDIFVIGNVITRGNTLMEEILNQNLPYTSGPQWLAENILRNHWVLAVAGTHGKTTTSSMLAWILEYAGLNPGFLIGGIPQNFNLSARIGGIIEKSHIQNESTVPPFFVIEADEYDTAFFDKRSKFVHYRPKTAILNNLEFDHADIFPDLAAIERQFHHLIRTIPSNGLIVSNGRDENITRVLEKGSWTPIEEFGTNHSWQAQIQTDHTVHISYQGEPQGILRWELQGEHNCLNALAALSAARHVNVPVKVGIEALEQFKNAKRRMEIRGIVNNITVYDDFAHHPTAIQMTINGLRRKIGQGARIIAILEPRSNTMKMGVWKDQLASSLADANQVLYYLSNPTWDVRSAFDTLGNKVMHCNNDLAQLIDQVTSMAKPGDHILVMSNGDFGGIHDKLLSALTDKNKLTPLIP